MSDNDSTLPNTCADTCVDASGATWQGVWMYEKALGTKTTPGAFDPTKGSIYPYIKSAAVYLCPDDSFNRNVVLNGVTYPGDSYAINGCLDAPSTNIIANNRFATGKSEAVFSYPAATLLLGEEDASGTANHTGGSTDDAYLLPIGNSLSGRHQGGSNVAFLDGHVKLITAPNSKLAALEYGDPAATACPGG
jgi:prepilin-type processing-associated H-X9-DG protein